jgi:tRNA(fMet)-specific endonuclease VapC
MNGRFLLDTNVVIDLLVDRDHLAERVAAADEVLLPVVALGELYYGARKSARSAENVGRVDEFAARNSVLECDVGTARLYGEIKSALRARGTPIPENDLWVAALARQYDLVLVTRDRHFRLVQGPRLEEW